MALAPPRRASAALDRSWRLPALTPARARERIDPVELILLVCFAGVSLWILAFDLITAATHHVIWTGTDGLYVPDQMQYLAWIRDSSEHLFASNLFVLTPTPHDYLQPAVAISGGLTSIGMAPWLALLLWKPVGVLGAFFAVRAFVRRSLPSRGGRLAALALALFFGSFEIRGDAWLPFWTWGYPYGLMAIAAVVAALLLYGRARAEGRVSWAAVVLGLIATWLHPWQGELLILMIVGAEALDWRAIAAGRDWRRRLTAPLITMIATALPLAYYAVLDRSDISWQLARGGREPHDALGVVLISLVPLAICAIPAYRQRPQNFLATATRVWPLAALVVYGVSTTGLGATPLHAFAGVTIPLGVLAVQGLQLVGLGRLRRGVLVGGALLAVATIPASVHMLSVAHKSATTLHNFENFTTSDVENALAYLRNDPEPGGVLANFWWGTILPAATDRHTYIGNCLWSVPNCTQRFTNTFRLFEWPEKPRVARAFVLSSGARFLLAGCGGHAGNLRHKLRQITLSIHRFGCMSVYEVL
jgi:hypothetical protein